MVVGVAVVLVSCLLVLVVCSWLMVIAFWFALFVDACCWSVSGACVLVVAF